MVVDGRVGGGKVGFAFLVGAHPDDGIGCLAALDLAIRGDQEPVFIDAAVDAERADESDVGSLGGFDGADAAVVRDMDVADFEAGAFAVQAPGAQGAQPALVGQLSQRVGLVDDLGQLAAAEEVLDGRADALGIDQRARRHVFDVFQAHALLNGAAKLEEALAQFVGGELVDRAEAPVAEVVDVVDVPLVAAEIENVPDGVDVVFRVEGHAVFRDVLIELAVDAEPADLAQAVAVGIEEFFMEQLTGFFELGGVAGAEPLIDPQEGAFVVGGGVFLERLEDQRVARVLEDEDFTERAGVGQDLRLGLGDGGAAVDQDLAGIGVDDISAGDPALELGGRLGIGRVDGLGLVERLEDRFVARVLGAHGAEQGHRRELARLVDAHAQGVFLGHLELDPASPFRNDAAGVELLVAGLDLDDEIDTGGTVKLADDHAFGAVDDELTAADHDRHVPQVDRFLEGGLTLVEPEPDVERAAVRQAELAAFVGVVPRLAEVVMEVFELEGLVVALDRENLGEDALEPGLAPLVGGQVGLEEPRVAAGLDLSEVRHRKLVGDPAEIPFLTRDDSPDVGRGGHGVALLKEMNVQAGRPATILGPPMRPGIPDPGANTAPGRGQAEEIT